MKIVGVIPARYGSTRFPGKPLKLLKGKPILEWVIDLTKKSKLLSDVIVATDHQEIFDLGRNLGAKCEMTTQDCATGTDRIFQALQKRSQAGENYDYVINIQGDEPLLPVSYIDQLAQSFLDNSKLDMVTLSHPLDPRDIDNMSAVKVLINQYNEAIYFSRFPIPYSRERLCSALQKLNYPVQKHIGLYGFKSSFLKDFCNFPQAEIEKNESLEQLRALYMGAKIKVISVEQPTYGIDTPEDLERLEHKL